MRRAFLKGSMVLPLKQETGIPPEEQPSKGMRALQGSPWCGPWRRIHIHLPVPSNLTPLQPHLLPCWFSNSPCKSCPRAFALPSLLPYRSLPSCLTAHLPPPPRRCSNSFLFFNNFYWNVVESLCCISFCRIVR